MKVYGNAMAGGSLSVRGIPTPTGPVTRPGRDALSLHRDRPTQAPPPTVDQPRAQDIRAWAIANGYRIATRGAIPGPVKTAYQQAHTTTKEKTA